jgi:hypothetical protein
MSNSTALTTTAEKGFSEKWDEIVDSLLAMVDQYPDEVVKSLEMLVGGRTTKDIESELNLTRGTVKKWLEKYPPMAMALAEGRRNLQKWRLKVLENQFYDAVKVSKEILEAQDSEETNAKLLAVKAQQSRYLIGLFIGQKIDVDVKLQVTTPVINGEQSAMDYLASKLNAPDEIVEGVYSVVETKAYNAGKKGLPLLDENDKPRFGVYGEITKNEDGNKMCHICGTYFSNLRVHVRSTHNVSEADYCMLFGVEETSVR